MRIRGRGAPPPPPDLPSSPPPSALHHGNDQSVQSPARNQSPPSPADDRRTSDLQVQTDGLILLEGEGVGANEDQEIGVGEEEGGIHEMRLASPSDRRGSNSSSSPETSDVMEHWREEDRTVPLKKRRPTLIEMETVTEIKAGESENKMVSVRRKRPKKWVEEDEEEKNGMGKNNGKKRRSGTGNGIMLEGSRCSRVNGRGWRCHQQTLVGYSLCEHHLGKGRLKSMTSVRNSPVTAPVLQKPTKYEAANTEEEEESESDDYEGTMASRKGKKKKIGGVKARSMSSLLGQTVTSPLPVTLQLSNGDCQV